jgi:hypothetical protein
MHDCNLVTSNCFAAIFRNAEGVGARPASALQAQELSNATLQSAHDISASKGGPDP